jgi:LacI family transcriptional regulator
MSIREVAKRAKVSIATVSRVMNNPGNVDPQTVERVRRAVNELNYFPDSHARSLVSGRSRILGLIVSDITNPFFPELVKGFEDVALRHGYEIMIGSTNYESVRMESCVRRMLERKVEGVAIMTSEMDQPLIEQLVRRKIPSVFLDVGSVHPFMSNIQVDYAAGIHQAVKHLLQLGHSKIGFISGPLGLKSARIRRQAFLEYLNDTGTLREKELVTESDHTIDGGLEAMTRLLERGEAPTAVLASNDLTAIGAMRAVRRKGLNVPADVSIIGFDDIHFAAFTEPPLTTVALSRWDLAENAFRALKKHIDPQEPDRVLAEYMVTPTLVVRESTAEPMLQR